jgi:hypothetical protein
VWFIVVGWRARTVSLMYISSSKDPNIQSNLSAFFVSVSISTQRVDSQSKDF